MGVRSMGQRIRVLRAARELETFNQAQTEPPENNVPETPEYVENGQWEEKQEDPGAEGGEDVIDEDARGTDDPIFW